MNFPTFVLPAGNDKYGFQHLSYHLFQAGLSDDLYHLVAGKKWYQKSTAFDPSGQQYGEDIRRAFQAIVEQIETDLRADHAPILGTLLARPAALAWLSASFGQAAKLISAPVLEAMTRLGEIEQATRRAEMMPDPVRRAEALTQIGEAAFALGQYDEAPGIWIRAQELLLDTPTDFFNEKLEALGQLTRTLARFGQVEEAMSLAVRLQVEVEAEAERAGGVTSTAHIALAGAWGAIGEKEKALTAVQSLTGARDKIIALCAVAEGLFSGDQTQALAVLDTALDLVSETNDKAALSELALHLAEAGRLPEVWQMIGDAGTANTRNRILLAAARGAFRRSDLVTGETLLAEVIQAAVATESEKDRLPLLAQLASVGHLTTNEKTLAKLLNLIKEQWQEFTTELDSRALGTVALGLLALGATAEAQAAVSAALHWKLPTDDWEENDALGELARTLGEVGNSDGLVWILQRARERQTAWQQAELAYHVTKAAAETDNTALAREARELMEAAALGKTEALPGANARGILAVWQAEKENIAAAQQLIECSIAELKKDPDGADALAYLALTLAHGQAHKLAGYVLQQVIDVLQQEFDPNILARATGTAAEAAAALKEAETLRSLKEIAETIHDDWLQAEALFWIAGWQAVLGHYDKARQNYLEAAVQGLWQSSASTEIETAWNNNNIDWIVDVAQDVGWPSTTAAALFAGLALVLTKPGTGWMEAGLPAIDHITEGYNHVRAVCYHLLLKVASELPDRQTAIIRYWVTALEYNRGRDVGEVWAVMKAGIALLYIQFGESFVKSLWRELARARNLLS